MHERTYVQLLTKILIPIAIKPSVIKFKLVIYTVEHPPKRILYSYKKKGASWTREELQDILLSLFKEKS